MDGRIWRAGALVAASLVPAALDASRSVGQGHPVDTAGAVAATAATLALLLVLDAAFDVTTRRGVHGAPAVALMAGVALVAAAGLQGAMVALSGSVGVPAMPPAHRTVATALRMGAASGVFGLGLFAMAVALPAAAGAAREAERLRVSAELARLRANLQPHFLFNTLSTVSGLVGEEPGEARRLVCALADLLRDSIAPADDTRTLGEEIAWLRTYAEILETRHRGALAFRWEIDGRTERLRVPSLLLQPLVENAVKHGALRRPDGGEILVRATLGERLTCVVEDDGPGPAEGVARPGALGLDLVTRRLALRYGRGAEVRLERAGGKTRATVSLPAEPSA